MATGSYQRVCTRQTHIALGRYAEHGHIHAFATQEDAKKALINDWSHDRLASRQESRLILAYTREDIKSLNELARAEKRDLGELGVDILIKTARGDRHFAIGDRIYFLKNDNGLGVKNGTLGTIEAMQRDKLSVRLDAKAHPIAKRVTFNTRFYNDFDHGYAATIHKSQGVTVTDGYLLASSYIDNHGMYVAGSRHTDKFNLYYSRELFATEQKLVQSLSRQRDKDLSVDYTKPELSPLAALNPRQAPNMPEQMKAQRIDPRALAAAQFQADLAKAKGQGYALTNDLSTTMAAKERTTMHRDANLQRYQAEFEAKHPSMAKAMQQSITPAYGHKAADALRTWQSLEASLTQSGMSRRAKESMQSYAAELQKQQPDVMQYLKLYHPDMCKQIESFVKSYQLDKDMGEISL